MADNKICTKCSGIMTQGFLKEIGNYGNSRNVFAPANEPSFPVKGATTQRREIIMYRCEKCGYLEMYAPEK
jgi:predicted nucleic-acid-binding Zn-ribbon protein